MPAASRASAAPLPAPRQDRAETKKLTDLKDLEKDKANADIEVVAQQEAAATKASARATGKKPASSASSAAAAVAPVRASGEIKVSFTKRHFATAARESHAAEEEEWLSKQMAARKAVNEAKEKAKEGGVEADPLWYKDKGNDFYKTGNYQSAINAYTAGSALTPPPRACASTAPHPRPGPFRHPKCA